MTTTKVMNCCPTCLEYPLVHACKCHTKPQHEGCNHSADFNETCEGLEEAFYIEAAKEDMLHEHAASSELVKAFKEGQEDMRRKCLEAVEKQCPDQYDNNMTGSNLVANNLLRAAYQEIRNI